MHATFVCLSTYLSIFIHIYLPTYLSVYLSIYLQYLSLCESRGFRLLGSGGLLHILRHETCGRGQCRLPSCEPQALNP